MSIYRSESMGYYHIAVNKESAWNFLNELGEVDLVQFVDMNPNLSSFMR